MMEDKLYLDCKFNGHLGQLISIGLAEGGERDYISYYAELPQPKVWSEWVEENIRPKLVWGKVHEIADTMPIFEVRSTLKKFLEEYENPTIYADFPADFYHLMRLMMGDEYSNSFVFPCTMVLLDNSECKSLNLHNALSDAMALRDWHESLQEEDSE